MQLDLLFLPLLGGYIFYTRFSLTAYRAARTSGERLIFNAAACGLLMLILSRALIASSSSVAANAELVRSYALSAIPVFGLILSKHLIVTACQSRNERGWYSLVAPRPAFHLLCASSLLLTIAMLIRVAGASTTVWFVSCTTASAVILASALLAQASRRLDVTTTVFRTSLFGLIALIAAYGFASRLVFVETWWTTFSPVHDSGTPFFACVLGAVLWLPLNLLFPYQSALAILHERNSTDELDAFLHKATEDKALVQLSLSGGKFYVGNIQQLPPNPAAAKAYVRVLPMVSGYRDETTKDLHFTSFYQDVYDELVAERKFREDWLETFVKLVPVDTIISANRFDPSMYIRFHKDRRRSGPKNQPASRRRRTAPAAPVSG